ncbi:MAG: YdiU family protein [Actinomycetota bacterium]
MTVTPHLTEELPDDAHAPGTLHFHPPQTFRDAVPELGVEWSASPATDPQLIAVNDDLAAGLGLDPDRLRTPEGVAVLAGNAVAPGSTPIAQAYAGHQFGNYSPRLGDGRALLLGELVDPSGRRVDLQLKGSGRTPFARGGDGRATLGPMLREYVLGEAMHALGVPSTRMLAVLTTGDDVARQGLEPGAIVARIAASHLRVGTFQFAAATGEIDVLRRLVDLAIERHHPAASDETNRAIGLLDAVIEVQIETVARWMELGFVHGVMNTDNVTISGETIDYGPCAFLDAHRTGAVFSSIDHGGRYAYGRQPAILLWDLARLAEALLPLIDDDTDRAVEIATETLQTVGERFGRRSAEGMARKIGLGSSPDAVATGGSLADELLVLLDRGGLDHTMSFRSLAESLRTDDAGPLLAVPAGGSVRVVDLAGDQLSAPVEAGPAGLADWWARWVAAVDATGRDRDPVADEMDSVNPVVVARNHLVEEALSAAVSGDHEPFHRLVDVVRRPFDTPSDDRYARPPTDDEGPYRTFCGT